MRGCILVTSLSCLGRLCRCRGEVIEVRSLRDIDFSFDCSPARRAPFKSRQFSLGQSNGAFSRYPGTLAVNHVLSIQASLVVLYQATQSRNSLWRSQLPKPASRSRVETRVWEVQAVKLLKNLSPASTGSRELGARLPIECCSKQRLVSCLVENLGSIWQRR